MDKEELKNEILKSEDPFGKRYALEILELVPESWLKQLELKLKLLNQEGWYLTYLKGYS